MDDKLQTLIDLQREQNELLRRYLWRLRFSLFGMLLATTAVAVALGLVIYQTRPPVAAPLRQPLVFPPASGAVSPGPAGDINVSPDILGTS